MEKGEKVYLTGCDLVTVQVPTGATFAHSTNRKIVLEFEGVCDKLLDTDIKVPGESTRWTETVYKRIYGKQYPGNVLLRRSLRRSLDLAKRKKLRERAKFGFTDGTMWCLNPSRERLEPSAGEVFDQGAIGSGDPVSETLEVLGTPPSGQSTSTI